MILNYYVLFFFQLFGIFFIFKNEGIKNYKKTVLFLSIFIIYLIALTGFRYDVGIDYLAYEDLFYREYMNFSQELFYVSTRWIIHSLTQNFTVFTLFYSALYIYILLKTFELLEFNPKESIFSLIVFSSNYLFLNFNLMRQSLAGVGLFYFLFTFFKKPIKMTVSIVMLMMFHRSIILVLPIYLFIYLINKRLKKRSTQNNEKLLLFFIVLFVVNYFFIELKLYDNLIISILPKIPYFGSRYSDYFQQYLNIGSRLSLSLIMKFVLFSFISFDYIRNYNRTDYIDILIPTIFVGLFLEQFSTIIFFINRISYYFLFGEIYFYTLFLRLPYGEERKIKTFLILFVYVLLFLKLILGDLGSHNLEYQSVFSIIRG